VRVGRLFEVAALFLRLGCTAFGGPAAHIALIEEEVVKKRGWLAPEELLDLIGAANLIPGPNSTELAMHVGRRRAGWLGLVLAGVCFILPAAVLVTVLAWAYGRFGALSWVGAIRSGVEPVILAVVLQALFGLGKKAVRRDLFLAALAVVAVVATVLGVNELLVLVACGGLALAARGRGTPVVALAFAPVWLVPAVAEPKSLGVMFLTFVKIGSVLFGSGYVLLAFLRADFVEGLGWLTEQQLLDAVAAGQVTPGPLFTAATYIGYELGGVGGAALATAGIFLPAFVFVALSGPLVPRLRASPAAGAFLDGVNVASLALMAVVSWQLGRSALADPVALAVCAVSAALLISTRSSSLLLIVAGAALGVCRNALAVY
jgi:chromate transporter